MGQKIVLWSRNTIFVSFHLLFFLTPLLLTPWNYELFEYNKMMFVYAMTAIIICAWAIQTVVSSKQQVESRKNSLLHTTSPLLLHSTLLLFLGSQVISTLVSIDPHVSVWGYYSRFNGGLLSTICYVLLYVAFIKHIHTDHIPRLFFTIFSSSVIVCAYGVAQHYGIDAHLWVQDVQNRIFSTLGQPNWLAAYLAILIPLAIGKSINPKSEIRNPKHSHHTVSDLEHYSYTAITLLLYLTLIFTKSRSGLIGVWVGIIFFFLSVLYTYGKGIKHVFFFFLFTFFFLHFLFGIQISSLNRYTLPQLITHNQQQTPNNQQPTTHEELLDVGVTESGDIRKIVWKGAIDIIKNYPLFGSGVETFAFSYYKYRPKEHNMTSEWDFLYNKAHNEFLNMAATTGLVGLGTHLLFIGSVILIYFRYINPKYEYRSSKQIPNSNETNMIKHESYLFRISDFDIRIFAISLLSGWLTILPTNFFGFSVVIVQIYFYLIPAMLYLLVFRPEGRMQYAPTNESTHTVSHLSENSQDKDPNTKDKTPIHKILLIIPILLATSYLLLTLAKYWYADTIFAKGYHASRSGSLSESYLSLHEALLLNRYEPFYFDELALTSSQLALALDPETSASLSAQLTTEAIAASDIALSISPSNVNFWKNRTRIFYALSQDDPSHLSEAHRAISTAASLSPTDPKIFYNLALVLNSMGKTEESYKVLERAADLKPNYKEPFLALALFYERDKKPEKAKEYYEYILKKIDPNDPEAKKKLEESK